MRLSAQYLVSLAVALGLLIPTPSKGQERVSLHRGDRIEVVSQALPEGIAVGWLTYINKDSVSFIDSLGVDTVTLPLELIGQIRKNIGRDGTATNVITIMGGLVTAGLATVFTEDDPRCRFGTIDQSECGSEVPIPLVGLLLGGGVSRLLTRSVLEERWVRVPLDPWLEAARAARERPIPD